MWWTFASVDRGLVEGVVALNEKGIFAHHREMSAKSTAPRVLVLYTEVAPYVLACLDELVARAGVQVDLVRWPPNAEAPFNQKEHPGITMHDRKALDDRGLLDLALRSEPQLVLASGWVDKGYLKVCRALHKRGVRTCVAFDTAWGGRAKQWLSAALARIWMPGTFSRAWVTGERQAMYARKLGFAPGHVLRGFYAADTRAFAAALPAARDGRSQRYPHRFIHVARYIPTKGQQLLCDAFAELCDKGLAKDWELHMVGTGESLDRVRNSTSGRHPRITHRGFVQAQDMPGVLAQAGASVLPSLYEPWGVVVQEHACMGLPLLLSDSVGAAERFLASGANGDLHRAGDKADLQRSLLRIIDSDDHALRAMGDRSAEMGQHWTPANWAEQARTSLLTR